MWHLPNRLERTHETGCTLLVLMICFLVEHFSGAAPRVMVEQSSPPLSARLPLQWQAADLMGLAAVEEKQRELVAYGAVRTKSREHKKKKEPG